MQMIIAMMALPQSVLQTFIGISYERFDLNSEDFDPFLAGSVCKYTTHSAVACAFAGILCLFVLLPSLGCSGRKKNK